MIFDLPNMEPPALIAPEPIRRKRRRNSGRNTALFVGAILLLSDGSSCRVVSLYPELLCVPVNPEN